LNGRAGSNPDSLLQEMMQNVLIRPTFDVERETQRYLQLSDLLKVSATVFCKEI
jgi:hypothetical protein